MSRRSSSRPFALSLSAVVFACGYLGSLRVHADASTEASHRGEALFAESCADCHGDAGEGVDGAYDDPLVGDWSIGELARVVEDTMPEGEPELIVGDDARAIAAWMHAKFYGEAAQLRARPPRILLSRLTGDQFRRSVADLASSYGPRRGPGDRGGLKAVYRDGSRWDRDAKTIERIDHSIDFHYGYGGPADGIGDIKPDDQQRGVMDRRGGFRATWTGSVIPPRDGWYEFVVQSLTSFELVIERDDFRLIDNRTSSGDRWQHRARRYLIGGRPYPIKLHVSHKHRVEIETPPAFVRLAWIPPGGDLMTIPSQCLTSDRASNTYTVQTKMPADDSSYGYPRGTSVDETWDAATSAAAIEVAGYAVSELFPRYRNWLAGQAEKKGEPFDAAKTVADFIEHFAGTAFRRPIDEAFRSTYVEPAIASNTVDGVLDEAAAVRRAVVMTLKSPFFLYPSLDAHAPPSHRVASRLALILGDGLPTGPLRHQADVGHLTKPHQVRAFADRLIDDPGFETKWHDFIDHYLELDGFDELVKSDAFPGFDPDLVERLRGSLHAQADAVLRDENGTFRDLIASDRAMTDRRLSAFYGDAWRSDGEPIDPAIGYRPTVADADSHVGVLTHPLVMAHLSYHDTTSPIHRGVFLTRRILGRVLRPPNMAFTPLDPDLHPGLTTRARVTLQTAETNCQVCHHKINGLGFALENFDAVGRFRDREHNQPIDASGLYVARDDSEVTFTGARELGDYLASSDDAAAAFIEAAFEFFVKQPPAAFGPDTARRLRGDDPADGLPVRRLIRDIAVTASTFPVDASPEARHVAAVE